MSTLIPRTKYISRAVRDRKYQVVNLSYRPADFDEEDAPPPAVEPAQWGACPYCGDRLNLVKGFDGPPDRQGRATYCSPDCVANMERQLAAHVTDSLIDYLLSLMPDAQVRCSGCGQLHTVVSGIARDDQIFCSHSCLDRSIALLVKRQPASYRINGIEI